MSHNKLVYQMSRADLAERFSVEVEAGVVTNLHGGKRAGLIKTGTSSTGGGYRHITFSVNGRTQHVQEHRLVWLFAYGEWPNGPLDHINQDRADNRIANLRLATGTQNKFNRGLLRNNTTGFKWVYRDSERGGWRAEVGYRDDEGRYKKFTARCETPEEAFEAACRFAKAKHGEFFNPGQVEA